MRYLLALLVLLAFVPAVGAQTGTANFTVSSRDTTSTTPAGIPVTVYAQDPDGPVVQTATASGGAVRVDDVPFGAYYAYASAGSDYITTLVLGAALVGADNVTGFTFVEPVDPARATVRGRLTADDSGDPVRLQYLVAVVSGQSPSDGQAPALTSVDGNGQYAFQVDPGSYSLDYVLVGNGSAEAVFAPAPVSFTVGAGSETIVDLALERLRPGVLAGTVTDAANGAPVQGARATAYAIDGTFTAETTTAADGTYRLDLPENDYTVEVESSYLTAYYDGAFTVADATAVTVEADQTTDGIDLALVSIADDFSVTLTGRLVDAAGTPVTDGTAMFFDADVRFSNADSSLVAVRAAADGTFEFVTTSRGVAGSALMARFKAPGFVSEFYDDAPTRFLATPLTVGAQAVAFDLGDIELAAEGATADGLAVSGVVTDDAGAPIEGATVILTRIDGAGVAYATSDAAGAYTADGLDAGDYVVLFAAEEYTPVYYEGASVWTDADRVSVRSNLSGISAQLGGLNRPVNGRRSQARNSVRGTVRDGSGRPVAGSLVVARSQTGTPLAFDFADATGRYNLGEFDEMVSLRVDQPGFDLESGVAMGGKGVLRFELDARVSTALGDGPEAEASGLRVAPNPVTGRADVSFTLETSARVRAEVYDALGRRVAVLVDDLRPAGDQRVTLDASGLAPGVYVVRVEAEGRVAATAVTVVR